MARSTGHASGPEAPLLPRASRFVREPRPWRDTAWLVAYLVVVLASVAGGVFAFVHRNKRYMELLSKEALSDPARCPLDHGLGLRQDDPDTPTAFDLNLFMKTAGLWILVSGAGSVLLGVLFLVLVKGAARALVGVAMVLSVAVPTGAGIGGLVTGQLGPGISMLAVAGLVLLLFVLWQRQVALVCELLAQSGKALWANPGLITISLGLQLVLGVMEVPFLMAAIAALMNGDLAYNTRRRDEGTASRPDMCVDDQGQEVSCCVWQTESWVPAFMALNGVAALWTLFLIFQIKMFVVAGAVAQWYFEPAAADPGARRPASRTLSSLRHALGPSLGSLCFASAVLTLVQLLRQGLEKARQERANNFLFAIVASCLSFLYALAEYATRFATIWMAITGEDFLSAGRNVVALLTRNFMDAFGVWWLPSFILQSTSFLLAGTWGFGTYMISRATWEHQERPQAQASAAVLGAIAFLCAWVVLAFFASLLVNAIDAIFVCYALDRDAASNTRPEVADVLSKLPTTGRVVENPDGGYAYGAPAGGHGSNV